MSHIRLRFAVLAGLAALVAAPASAAQKRSTPSPGEEVIVTQSASGTELRGRLVDLSSTSLAILVNGQRVDVPIDTVLRIDVRNDSLKNGAIIGASIWGGLTAVACGEFRNRATCVTGMIFNTGFGALIGAGIDALHKGRTPIYIRTAGKSATALQLKFTF